MINKNVKVTIIVPALPPEPYLPELTKQIEKHLNRYSHETLIQTERGLSYAVQCGVKKAKGNIIVVMDADGSHNPKYIPSMIEAIQNGYDLALGSRYCKGGTGYPLLSYRNIVSRLHCWPARILLRLKVHDPSTGFIAAKKTLFQKINMANKSFKFGFELLCMTKNVIEIPIIYEKRKKGFSKASCIQSLDTIKLMLKLM